MIRPRFLVAAAAAACLSACQHESRDLLSVVVSMPETNVANATKATILVDYSGTEAKIANEGGIPACAFILPGIDGEFADDRKGTLTIHTQGPRALRGPADIVACQMQAAADATAASLHERLSVRVTAAEDATGKAIDVSAKTPHGRGATPERTDAAIEAAQAEAVKSAAAIVSSSPSAVPLVPGAIAPIPGAPGAPTPPPGTPAAPGATAFRTAPGVVSQGSSGPAGGASGTNRPAPQPPSARPLVAPAPGGGMGSDPLQNNAPANVGNPSQDNGGVAGGGFDQDSDPSYDDSCDPLPPAYTVEIQVTSGARIGALQLDITHLGKSGCFIGRGADVECVPLVDALVAANYRLERTTSVGMISLQGFQTPNAIMRCGFRTKESLSPESFLVQVTDASDKEGDALDPVVVVSSVTRR